MSRWSDLSDAEFDTHLADELHSLADESGPAGDWVRLELLPAVRGKIGPRTRASAAPRASVLAGVAGLAGLALVVLSVALLRAPPSSPGGPYGEAVAGDFVLTIRADQPTVVAGERIDVASQLGYQGDADGVVLSGSGTIIAFAIRQLDGPLATEIERTADCARYELLRGEPISRSFSRSGGWSRDDPHADFYEDWFRDPELRLPAGRWEIIAESEFTQSPDCAGQPVRLRASIVMTVLGPSAAPATPRPTPPSTIVGMSTPDFAARVAAGELRGEAVLVTGEITVDPATDPILCPDPLCPMGLLAGVEPELTIHARWTPVMETDDGATERTVEYVDWRWWALPEAPVGQSLMVLYLAEDGTVEYIGRQYEERFAWGLSTLTLPEYAPEMTRLDEVIVVPAWLTGIAVAVSCAPPEPGTYISGLPQRRCGGPTWLAGSPVALDPAGFNAPEDGVQVQNNVYDQFADLPRTGPIAEPRPGLYTVSRRLEGGGCPENAPPCWRWNLVARVAYEEPVPAMPIATPPTPEVGPPSPQPTFQEGVLRPGLWVLAATERPTAQSTTLELVVHEAACASGEGPEGRIVGPDIDYAADAVTITFRVRERTGSQDCQGAPGASVAVALSEPLGTRVLVDGGFGEVRAHEREPGLLVLVDPAPHVAGQARLEDFDREPPDRAELERMADELGSDGGFLDGGRAWLGEWLDAAHAFGAFEAIDGRPKPWYMLARAAGQPWLPPNVTDGAIVLADLEPVNISGQRTVWLPAYWGYTWAIPGDEGCAAPDGLAIPLPTSPPNTTGFCRLAGGGGLLAPHPDTVLGVAGSVTGNVLPIIWPHGYTARRDDDGTVVLLDPAGQVVARQGDRVSFAGGFGNDGIFHACGEVSVH